MGGSQRITEGLGAECRGASRASSGALDWLPLPFRVRLLRDVPDPALPVFDDMSCVVELVLQATRGFFGSRLQHRVLKYIHLRDELRGPLDSLKLADEVLAVL
ncbi:hypothetical protein [Streptomyces olivaceiscleroticus]|uniref:Uncharacterized protein n=1 Tax=Streptomyces olivaceiscleroticus TaxID=68245 RepID=A0ABN1ADY9_9ACTN